VGRRLRVSLVVELALGCRLLRDGGRGHAARHLQRGDGTPVARRLLATPSGTSRRLSTRVLTLTETRADVARKYLSWSLV